MHQMHHTAQHIKAYRRLGVGALNGKYGIPMLAWSHHGHTYRISLKLESIWIYLDG